jgi:hypothetical protein
MRFRVTTLSRRWLAGPGRSQVSFHLPPFDLINLIILISIINTAKQFIWFCHSVKIIIKNGLENDIQCIVNYT